MKLVRAFDIPLPAVIASWDLEQEGENGRETSSYRVVLMPHASDVEVPGTPRPLQGRALRVEHRCADGMGEMRWHTVEDDEGSWVLAQVVVAALGLAPGHTINLWGES